jgi:SAM-dependent methyltransferase
LTPTPNGQPLTEAERREIYELESALAAQLRNAGREERRLLYSSLYEEYFRKLPHHPQLVRKASPAHVAAHVRKQMAFLQRFLDHGMTFLEVGPGDCALAMTVAAQVKQVYAVDVSATISEQTCTPANFCLILSDGASVPVPPGSVQLAYSYQLMEHLHPDDAIEQVSNLYAALAPNGRYLCITPNRLSGPHDISRYFDLVATGFHLKEYTVTELSQLFRAVGFRRLELYIGAGRFYIAVPFALLAGLEWLLEKLPARWRRWAGRSILFRGLLGIRMVATK